MGLKVDIVVFYEARVDISVFLSSGKGLNALPEKVRVLYTKDEYDQRIYT